MRKLVLVVFSVVVLFAVSVTAAQDSQEDTVTIKWQGVYLYKDSTWKPLEGFVVYAIKKSYRDPAKWQYCFLEGGICTVKAPQYSVIPWATIPPDDDICFCYDPPTPQGPGCMGVFEDIDISQEITSHYYGLCSVPKIGN